MTKIAWVTDTGALLTPAFIAQHNVHVLPLNIVFEEGAYRETIDITHKEFYEKLRATKVHPTSSQPNFGEHVALYESLKEQGYDVAIAIHTSGRQSGTASSAPMAAQQAGFTSYTIDSMIGSYPMQKMLEKGFELEKQGATPEEIVAEIEALCPRSELSFIPANLEKLHKSGRVSGTAMFLSNLLNIKLVISYDKGVCVVTQKVRAEKRAKKAITDLLDKALTESSVTEVAVIHTNNVEGALAWRKELEVSYPNMNFIITELSAVVGALTGEGTLGLSWVRS
ncbi:DegV family protein [Lysinibacillus sp. LZ02]|uniref:DegV family protein n=1 Tax=Lysinibacillus sp. LZ02 TaxID=3420668 RepID=UPI003D368539